jgi:hypothetical protein
LRFSPILLEAELDRSAGAAQRARLSRSAAPSLQAVVPSAPCSPEVGGDAMFANMYLACETLSDTMRGVLDRPSAEHGVAQVLHDYDRRAPALSAAAA